jgi:hypothetical protein
MKKLIRAGILAGLVIFIWGVISWMLIPWHSNTLHHFKDESAVATVLQTNVVNSGVYFMPQSDSINSSAETAKPMIFASIELAGMSSSMTKAMAITLLTQVLAAFLVAWLLMQTVGLSFFGRVGFVMVFAIACGLVSIVPYWNWFAFDWKYSLVSYADLLIGWYFAALVLAKFCKK